MVLLFCFALFVIVLNEPLLLTPLINQGKYEEARKLSKVTIDGYDMGHSAFITVPSESGENNNNIFFWLQPCRNCDKKEDAPFVLWLQGGPGAPGTFGCLTEVGNYWIDKNLKVQERCFSWCDHYNCLFVDQPVMTGFSYQTNKTGGFDPDHIEYTQNSPRAMEEVYQLITQLFKVWDEFKDAPFIITGESYGGQYTPNMGWVIHQHNVENEKLGVDQKINLVGLSVGDPVIDCIYQWPTYADTLYGMGVIMLDERDTIQTIMDSGVKELKKKNVDCVKAFNYWNSVWNDDQSGSAFLFSKYTGSEMTCNALLGSDPGEYHWLVTWENQTSIAKAMHYDGTPSESRWEGGDVYDTMVKSGDFCRNSSYLYAKLFLEAGIDLQIYSSTMDPLLGPPTTEAGVHSVWDYAAEYLDGGRKAKEDYYAAKKVIWKVKEKDDNIAGYAKCFTRKEGNRFCYSVVRNAGHMTPSFEPRATYDLMERFVNKRPFTKEGEDPKLPTCGQCGGAPPFAGSALPECN